MDATAKYKNKKIKSNQNKKIVKYNKKRLLIIVTVVIVLLSGLGVGLYFALRDTLPSTPGLIILDSPQEAQEKVDESAETGDRIGIIFESPECMYCNYLMYGEAQEDAYNVDEISSQDEAQGPFAQYAKQSSMQWYAVQGDTIEESHDQIDEFFVGGLEEPDASPYSGANYIGTLSNDDVTTYALNKTTVDIQVNYDSEGNLVPYTDDITNDGTTTDNGTPTEPETTDPAEPVAPTTSPFAIPLLMWFDDGQLQFFSMGTEIPSTDEEGNPTNNGPTVQTFLDLESDEAYAYLGRSID